MKVAVCIFAKNEAKNLERLLPELAKQTFLSSTSCEVVVHVVANGCSDDTVHCASAMEPLFSQRGVSLKVSDLHPGGKSRAWNRAVHELVDPETIAIVCMDADIEFTAQDTIAQMLALLNSDPLAAAIAGYPIKDVAVRASRSLLGRFSTAVSKETRHINAICGQLYAVRAESIKDVWLPNETPGEDGFLNAMLMTRGFTRQPDSKLVRGSDRPTHLFKTVGPKQFWAHERRLIVGTVINRWIFEYLWSLQLHNPAGPLIRSWNEQDPTWVESLISSKAKDRWWLVPNSITFGRLRRRRQRSRAESLLYLPVGLAATIATLIPALAANRALKCAGSAALW